MAASSSDKFRKVARRWVGQIGSGGVSDGSVTTIPLSSATNLPTDTGVTAVIDRVDANGTATSSLEETVVGVVSGSNLVSCIRGVEGTAQAHSAGAVVEILITADGYNDIIDGILVGHDQDGSHKTSLPLTTPKITTSINDANGNEVVKTPATSSAVNEVTITNAATGNNPSITATGDDTTAALALAGKSASVLATGEYDNGNSGTSKAISWKNGDRQKVTITGACTFTFSNAVAGQYLHLRVVIDGTGGYSAPTWPTLKWPGGTATTPTMTANAINLFIFYYDGTNYLAQGAANFS